MAGGPLLFELASAAAAAAAAAAAGFCCCWLLLALIKQAFQDGQLRSLMVLKILCSIDCVSIIACAAGGILFAFHFSADPDWDYQCWPEDHRCIEACIEAYALP